MTASKRRKISATPVILGLTFIATAGLIMWGSGEPVPGSGDSAPVKQVVAAAAKVRQIAQSRTQKTAVQVPFPATAQATAQTQDNADPDRFSAQELAEEHGVAHNMTSEQLEQVEEETLSPRVLAVLSGDDESDGVVFDPDQPAVAEDNVHAAPTGEFAEQILEGDSASQSFESEIYGFERSLEAPGKENHADEPSGEHADQIAQATLLERAALSGLNIDRQSIAGLPEVDPDSHPPTEAGASGEP